MKPGEFDELVKQKFDQNDFAYNARNWERLAEQMDGRAKKRSMLMWLWMPATGMAASVALAIGVTSLFHLDMGGNKAGGGYAATGKFMPREREERVVAMVPNVPYQTEQAPAKPQPTHARNTAKQPRRGSTAMVVNNGIGLKLQNMADDGHRKTGGDDKYAAADFTNSNVNVNAAPPAKAAPPKVEKKPAVAVVQPMETFREQDNKPALVKKKSFSVILSGGVNQGSNNSGYMAGATVRKMINDKVYVESDIAYANSDNVQRTKVMSQEPVMPNGAAGGIGSVAGKVASASKVSDADAALLTSPTTRNVIKTQDITYNLSYAQITPGIGVKVMKRMSIGMGPDFQAMLQDNRPATSIVDRENIAVAPTFDVGFVGKTEVSFTNRIKAAVAYRKGVNGVINPSGKFIDRDYVQFQMKCAIFNR